eukprot:scaffold586_cov129-Isochrysis_galbana.AAC.1
MRPHPIHGQKNTTKTHNSVRPHPPKTRRVGPGSGINPNTTQTQTPRGVTVGTLIRGPPLR